VTAQVAQWSSGGQWDRPGEERTEARSASRTVGRSGGWSWDWGSGRSRAGTPGWVRCRCGVWTCGKGDALAEGMSRRRAGCRSGGMRRGRGDARSRSRSEDWSWGWSEGWNSGKGSARTRSCSYARSDAMTGGCSEGKGSPSYVGDGRPRQTIQSSESRVQNSEWRKLRKVSDLAGKIEPDGRPERTIQNRPIPAVHLNEPEGVERRLARARRNQKSDTRNQSAEVRSRGPWRSWRAWRSTHFRLTIADSRLPDRYPKRSAVSGSGAGVPADGQRLAWRRD
jgi:hypothetical protein